MMSDATFLSILFFVAGLVIGKWLTDRRWRSVAVRGYRSSSGGRLYEGDGVNNPPMIDTSNLYSDYD